MKIVGVAACITGVAHTYMAQEAIEQECKKEVMTSRSKLRAAWELKMN